MKESFRLLKMQATGNDFLILDGSKFITPGLPERAEFAKRYCHRIYGFGADGLIFLEKTGVHFSWDFYNSDGSQAAMCGNAARAVGRFLTEQSKSHEVIFGTTVGQVTARKVTSESNLTTIEVEWELASTLARPVPWYSGQLIDTGVAHVVVKVPSIDDLVSLKAIGLDIKSKFRIEGMNVTFYTSQTSDSIKAVTFERGVEDFTLSCGTGALAAACVHLQGETMNCKVKVPGGSLEVTFHGKKAILRGEARYIGWCTPLLEDLGELNELNS
jgi:diaminopimelate epimerase